jgi:Na+/melibiose symporter-like transporter
MITKTSLKSCVSPAVAFTFTVVSVTGVLMLFDIDRVDDLHKWMGFTFVFAGIMHLVINWRALVVHFNGRKIVLWGAVMLLICALLSFEIGDNDRDIHDDGNRINTNHIEDMHD